MLVVAAPAKLKAIPYVGVLLPMGVFRPLDNDAKQRNAWQTSTYRPNLLPQLHYNIQQEPQTRRIIDSRNIMRKESALVKKDIAAEDPG
jgi:hypothetical protein